MTAQQTEERKERARRWFETLRDRLVAAFEAVEDALTDRGKTPATSTLEEMDALWDDAKRRERQQ